MKRILAALALVCLAPTLACAQPVNITNFRPAYGPHGSTRVDAANPKLVPGDVMYAEYTIEGLATDTKTGRVRYDTVLEFFDNTGKRLLERKTPNDTVPQLGGSRMPGSLFVSIGSAFTPGKYMIKLTIDDKVAGKAKAVLQKNIQVIPMQLAFTQVSAIAVALPGEPIAAQCAVVGFVRDKKGMMNVEVTVQVLDAAGKAASNPAESKFPAALPPGVDPTTVNELLVPYPLTPNRPGQFIIEIVAKDKNAKDQRIELKLPIVVIDVGKLVGNK
jgi:hypothetical protein